VIAAMEAHMVSTTIRAGLFTILFWLAASIGCRADGVSAVKSCEADNEPPEDIARLTLMPSGEPRGSASAAALIKIARQKAKEGKDAEGYNGLRCVISLSPANRPRSSETALQSFITSSNDR